MAKDNIEKLKEEIETTPGEQTEAYSAPTPENVKEDIKNLNDLGPNSGELDIKP